MIIHRLDDLAALQLRVLREQGLQLAALDLVQQHRHLLLQPGTQLIAHDVADNAGEEGHHVVGHGVSSAVDALAAAHERHAEATILRQGRGEHDELRHGLD